ncbi:MAG: efflux RND transporter permease subunit [Actinomycetota bacterium]
MTITPETDVRPPDEESELRTTPPATSDGSGRRSIITTIATGAARRWRVTLAFLLVIIGTGAWAYGFGLNREGFPPVNTPFSVVSGTWFVDDAEQIDRELVVPLAEAFADVADVTEVSSESRPSSFAVFVEFDDSLSSEEGTARLAALQLEVPDGASVDYRSINAAKFVGRFDLLVSIVGPSGATPDDLQAQADDFADFLAADSEIELAEVRDLLTTDDAGETRQTRFTRVALGPEGYEEAIAIGVIRAESSDLDVLEFTDRVENRLDDPALPLADGYRAEVTADFAEGIRTQLSSLTGNLFTGLVAVAIVSLLLIGWRVAIMTAGFMLLVIIGALVGLWAVGYTLNTITLFGLILTLGLLVDDAVVISESIDANRDDPDPEEEVRPIGVIRRAIDKVGSASFAGTLTTVVVFSPLLFIGGILGEFIRPIPATVIVTLLMSFAFSIVFIPTAARGFLLRGGSGKNPIVTAEKAVARAVGRVAGYPSGNGWKGRIAGFGLAGVAIVALMGGQSIASGLGFSVFPQGKDSTALGITADFDPGTTIEEAEAISDEIDEIVLDELGDELVRSQYIRGNERLIETFLDLTPIDSRSTTALTFVERIEERADQLSGVRVTVSQVENGPPTVEFPFAVQISVSDDEIEAGEALAEEIRTDLIGREIDDGSGVVTVTDAIISTEGVISRVDSERQIEVRAQYDEDQGISGILNETEAVVIEAFPPELVEERGLDADALGFDFGDESDNQDDFAALGVAGLVALILMLLLISIQFRSIAQSLLIFLAIPFGFLGVSLALSATDNPFSFLAAVGFIALIGVAVNNTILLVDAANQERRKGATAGEAISAAVTSRFRPLVATTITTVVGLLPLSISDPFWESLGFTLMGGLVSSTLLVLISFPAFYLGLEAVRTPIRNAVRTRRGKEPIPR